MAQLTGGALNRCFQQREGPSPNFQPIVKVDHAASLPDGAGIQWVLTDGDQTSRDVLVIKNQQDDANATGAVVKLTDFTLTERAFVVSNYEIIAHASQVPMQGGVAAPSPAAQPNPYGGGVAPSGANPYGGPAAPNPTPNPYGAPASAPNPYGGAGGAPNPYGAPGGAPNPYGASLGAANPYGGAASAGAANPYGGSASGGAPNPYGGSAGAPNPYGGGSGGGAANPYGGPAGAGSAGSTPYGAAFGSRAQAGGGAAPGGNPYGAVRGGGGGGGGPITPIRDLSIYNKNWTVKAMVVSIAPVKAFNKKAGGEGRLQTVIIRDASDKLRCTLWSEAIDAFASVLQERKTYTFSGGQLKQADQRWNPGATVECSFGEYAQIQEVADDPSVPTMTYNFVPLNQVTGAVPVDSRVDVAGVVRHMEEEFSFTSKAGKQLRKKEIVVMDEGGQVDMTMWGQDIDKYQEKLRVGAIILLKEVKVGEFNSKRSLSTQAGSFVDFVGAADHPRAAQLDQWWRQNQGSLPALAPRQMGGSVSGPVSTVVDARAESDALTKDLHALRIFTGITNSERMWYPACPQPNPQRPEKTCNKKAIEDARAGDWTCSAGCKFRAPTMRYIMSVDVFDHTGTLKNVKVFDEVGSVLIGKSADEMCLINQQNPPLFDQIIAEARCKLWTVKVKSKPETFNDKENLNRQIIAAEPMDGTTFGRHALDALQEVRGVVGAF